MRTRVLAPVLALALLVGACGDDGGEDAPQSVGDAATTSITPSDSTVAGPTQGDVACVDLAERYVRRARALFVTDGTPSDALVSRVRARLAELDAIAATAGCGEEYTSGVCEGLDALTADGILVIIPLTTAQCL